MEIYFNFVEYGILFNTLALTVILILPIPTTPALLYIILNMSLLNATVTYFLASTLNCILIFGFGSLTKRNRLLTQFFSQIKNQFDRKISISSFHKFLIKIKGKYDIKETFKHATLYDIAMARIVGVHNHAILFTYGYLDLSPVRAIIVNLFFASLDIAFYWIVFGTGGLLLNYIFPEIDLKLILQSDQFTQILIGGSLTFYFLFILYRFLRIYKINTTEN